MAGESFCRRIILVSKVFSNRVNHFAEQIILPSSVRSRKQRIILVNFHAKHQQLNSKTSVFRNHQHNPPPNGVHTPRINTGIQKPQPGHGAHIVSGLNVCECSSESALVLLCLLVYVLIQIFHARSLIIYFWHSFEKQFWKRHAILLVVSGDKACTTRSF